MMTFENWKQKRTSISSRDVMDVGNFEILYPATAQMYRDRVLYEKKRRSEIMAIKDPKKRRETIARNLDLYR